MLTRGLARVPRVGLGQACDRGSCAKTSPRMSTLLLRMSITYCNHQDLTVTLEETFTPHNPQQWAIRNDVQNYALLTYPLPKAFNYCSYYPDSKNISKDKAQTDERTLASL